MNHFFWVQIDSAVARDVFGQAVYFESLFDSLAHDIFEAAHRVLAELTGV